MFKEDRTKALEQALAGGVDIETASHYAGLSVNEVYRALERGKVDSDRIAAGGRVRAAETPYRQFFERLRTARAATIVRNSATVQRASGEDWRAAAWWLERAGGQQFAKPNKGNGGEIEGAPAIEQ